MNIIEKIQKLLAKAHDTNNPNESAAFFAKAHALQLQHKIVISDLKTFTEESIGVESVRLNEEDAGKSSLATWKGVLALVISKSNGCFRYRDGARIVLVGKTSDCEAVRNLIAIA